jgi:hypothetical protein
MASFIVIDSFKSLVQSGLLTLFWLDWNHDWSYHIRKSKETRLNQKDNCNISVQYTRCHSVLQHITAHCTSYHCASCNMSLHRAQFIAVCCNMSLHSALQVITVHIATCHGTVPKLSPSWQNFFCYILSNSSLFSMNQASD